MGGIGEEGRREIREALAAAPHGRKGRAAKDLAGRFGCSVGTVYRAAGLGGAPRLREPLKPEYRGWVEHAVALAHRAQPPAALDLAIESAVAAGGLPREALAMPIGTAYRIARELGYRPPARRTQRLHADWPLQAVQVDGSTSKHLVPERELEGGDWLLKVHRKPTPASGYKNKPLGAHRMRAVCYGVWDMCTGLARADYVVAQGESALDALTVMLALLGEGDDPARPLAGVPENLWHDNGPLFKSDATRGLLSRIGIAVVPGPPYRKERQGGVERSWRTLWQRFEASILLEERTSIALSELRRRLADFERRQGRLPSRTPVDGVQAVSRARAWRELAHRRPADKPLRRLPPNALQTLFKEAERRLDRNGILRWDGREWECLDWHLKKVLVREPLDGGGERLTLEDPGTGERSLATPYRPRAYGQVRGQRKDQLERLRERLQPVGGAVYGREAAPAAQPEGDGKVVHLAARLREAEELENPLDAERHPSLQAAMAAFAGLYPYPLSPADRQAVERRLAELGLARAAVAELASSLLAAIVNE